MPPREGQSAFMTLPSTLALMKVAADVGGRVESKWGGPGLWGRWAKPAQFICFCCISSFDLQTREGNDSGAGNSCRLCPCLSLVPCTLYCLSQHQQIGHQSLPPLTKVRGGSSDHLSIFITHQGRIKQILLKRESLFQSGLSRFLGSTQPPALIILKVIFMQYN